MNLMKLKKIMILGVLKFFLFLYLTLISFTNFAYGEPIEALFAEIQILDKITAKVKTYNIATNGYLEVDTLKIEIYACYKTPPEQVPENYVLLKIFDDGDIKDNKLIYQGWMISSSPASTPLEHPIYDLWLKECKIVNDF